MKIQEAADRLGLTTRAIRFYEQKGLLSPASRRTTGTASSGRRISSGCA
nr:MerR family DNA-binding transcriptional regulator [Paenibacillus thiaminolyticus]